MNQTNNCNENTFAPKTLFDPKCNVVGNSNGNANGDYNDNDNINVNVNMKLKSNILYI